VLRVLRAKKFFPFNSFVLNFGSEAAINLRQAKTALTFQRMGQKFAPLIAFSSRLCVPSFHRSAFFSCISISRDDFCTKFLCMHSKPFLDETENLSLQQRLSRNYKTLSQKAARKLWCVSVKQRQFWLVGLIYFMLHTCVQ